MKDMMSGKNPRQEGRDIGQSGNKTKTSIHKRNFVCITYEYIRNRKCG